jgi:hypothetical protein
LLGLAAAKEFERGFDTFGLACVGVVEELVDLEPTKFSVVTVLAGRPLRRCE